MKGFGKIDSVQNIKISIRWLNCCLIRYLQSLRVRYIESSNENRKKLKLNILKKLPMQMLQYILIKIFAINLFLTRCFYLKFEKKPTNIEKMSVAQT